MVETFDTAVEIVLDALERNGLADRTLIVLTSDNGRLATTEGSPTTNSPWRAGKGWLYEGGIRVPAIAARLPGRSPADAAAVLALSAVWQPTGRARRRHPRRHMEADRVVRRRPA
jgi:arylsulfatase A-like enzyme